MLPAKKNKLSDIKDEVREFHPILEKLFWELPSIKDVEYTQGSGEKGADFVLLKEDEISGYDDYIGVIVKVGAIHQNYAEIERQIKECKLPRFFKNGKEKIRIREVWIVATGTVTGGATEKIYEEFKNEKINFYDGKRLEKLIEKYIPFIWDTSSVEISKYLSDQKQRATEADKRYSLIPTISEDVYIEQDVCTYPKQEYRLNLKRLSQGTRKINIYETIQKQKIILIEAEMGMGKTKLLRHLLSYYSSPEIFAEAKLIPIPVSFKKLLDDFDLNILAFIESHISEKIKEEIDDETKYLLLIDALDEKKQPLDEQIRCVEKLVEEINKIDFVKVVMSSRKMKSLEESTIIKSNVNSYFLKPLTFRQTIQLIEKICSNLNLTNRITNDLKRSHLFNDIPKNPIAIILLATLLSENQQEVPSNITELYEKYIEYALGRWDIKKGLQSQKEYEALSNIMMNLAKHILDYDMSDISVDEAKSFFNSYLSIRTTGIEVDELFDLMMNRTEVMAYNFDGTKIGFKHRTFAEFFYAKAGKRDRDMLINNRAFQFYWMNSIFFYLGLEKDAPKILSELIRVEPQGELEEWLKILNMSNFFLAAYLTPKDISKNLIVKVMTDAAKLYLKIVAGESENNLIKLPRMHLLWLFQTLIRESYSYDSFKSSLEDASLEIVQGDYEDKIKYYSLFFIGVTLADLTKDYDFEFLLKESASNLPADISLAYVHETEKVKNKTRLMKKTEKRVKKLLGGDRLQLKKIKELYENPIKALKKATKNL